MKILYVANIRLPTERTHGIQIMKMSEAFSETGANVELVVPRRLNHIKADPFDYYEVRRNFKITKLPCLDLMFINSGKFGFLLQTITFLVSVKIYLVFRAYDVLYTREQLVGLFFKNFILEVHALPKRVSKIHRILWQKTKAVVVLTSFIRNELVAAGVNSERVLVAPDGVDISQFTAKVTKKSSREKLGLPKDKHIVLYTGHLYSWKGADTLALAAEKMNNALIIFVGGVSKHVSDFIKRYESVPNVKILGQKPYSEIPEYLCSADVLVLPNSAKENISCFYTSPLKLFEYMASGRPIVTSDLPSIREVLDTKTAYFFEPDNPDSLAQTIVHVLSHKEEADEKSLESFSRVKEYSWRKRAEKILGFVL